VTTC